MRSFSGIAWHGHQSGMGIVRRTGRFLRRGRRVMIFRKYA